VLDKRESMSGHEYFLQPSTSYNPMTTRLKRASVRGTLPNASANSAVRIHVAADQEEAQHQKPA
jgi:hypothetical protein